MQQFCVVQYKMAETILNRPTMPFNYFYTCPVLPQFNSSQLQMNFVFFRDDLFGDSDQPTQPQQNKKKRHRNKAKGGSKNKKR